MNMNNGICLRKTVFPARICLRAEAANMLGAMLVAVLEEQMGLAGEASRQAVHLLAAAEIFGTMRETLGKVDECADAPFGAEPAPSVSYIRVPADSRGRVGWRRPADGCGL